jgi:hypothetical protein
MRNVLRLNCFIVLLFVCVACGSVPEGMPELTLEALKDAEYRSGGGGFIKLTDGIYYPTPTSGESQEDWFIGLSEPIAFGDLNDDGVEDAVVILRSRYGGTGVFKELAIVINRDGKPYNVATRFLGDRVIVNAISIQSGEISVELITHGPNDGFCCPSMEETWRFRLSEDELLPLSNP